MSEVLTYDNLFAGNVAPIVADVLTLATGQKVARGAVLGIVTASGKAALVDSSKTTGEQIAYAIASDAADATGADVLVPVYLTGEFNGAALTFGGTDTADTHKSALRKIGIFLKTNVKA